MPKHDWTKIENEYVSGSISDKGERIFPILEDLANKYGVKPKTVRRHSAEGRWRNKRKAFQEDLEERSRRLRIERRAREELDFHDNCLKITKGGIVYLANHLQQYLDDFEAAKKLPPRKDEDGKLLPPLPPLGKTTLQALEAVARTLEKLQKAGCVALGIPDKNTALSGPAGSPIEIVQLTPEELDRRIQDQYKQLGYAPPESSGENGEKPVRKTTLSEAILALQQQSDESAPEAEEKDDEIRPKAEFL